LRTLAFLLAVIGGAKLAIPLIDGVDTAENNTGVRLYDFIGPVSAAKVDESKEVVIKPQQCETPEAILMVINEERDLLNNQKAALEERRASVSLAEEKLKQDTARLGRLKSDLEDLFMRAEKAKSDDLKRLVQIYRGMKPKEAAAIMNTLDIEVAVLVLAEMKERDAAPIFAKMNVVRSQAISKIIFERSKLPGDQNLNGIALQ
jgi:flagellar motility protein MotE (MotC chaperone)